MRRRRAFVGNHVRAALSRNSPTSTSITRYTGRGGRGERAFPQVRAVKSPTAVRLIRAVVEGRGHANRTGKLARSEDDDDDDDDPVQMFFSDVITTFLFIRKRGRTGCPAEIRAVRHPAG